MIKIDVKRDSNGLVTAVRALGHANYADYGEDIICSAVTAVITTAMAGLEDLLGVKHTRTLLEGDVALELDATQRLTADVAEKSALMLETCVLGLKQIEYSYGNEYLAVQDPKADQRSID